MVRRAFERAGHEAWSCDLVEARDGGGQWGRHLRTDVRMAVLECGPWDLMIAHPPCTRLASSGARWMAGREPEIAEALDLVRWLLVFQREIGRVCVENPVGLIGTRVRPSDQVIHPWQHGHPEKKATCLWLRRLPLLRRGVVIPEWERTDRLSTLSPGVGRAAERSRTFEGIAEAMASQWGPLLER